MRIREAALVERERELEALDGLLTGFPETPARLAVIEAPAGLGKTALLRHTEKLAVRRGLRVLSARGSELERDYPFALVAQLLSPVLAAASPGEREALLRGAAALALSVLEGPYARSRAIEEAGDHGMSRADPEYAALHGLYWLVANLGEEGPTLLSIDDLHWADAASLRFLSFLEARLEGMPVVVVCARRPREPGVEEELLERLGTGPPALRVGPSPLTSRGTAELLERVFEAVPDRAFASACHDACAGNPFYLEVLASELRESAVEPTEAHAARIGTLVPAGITRTVLLRLSRLEPAAVALAKAVAVLGDDARLEAAADLAGVGAEQASNAAAELARVSILRRSEHLTFVHPIVRATIYGELSPQERSDAHLRAARRRDAAPEQVASHLLRTAPRGDAKVVERLREVGERAVERGAPEGAVAYLTRALGEPPSKDVEGRVLAELGLAEARAADPAAIDHLRAARAAEADPIRRGEVSLALGRILLLTGAFPEAIDVVQAAAEQTREVAPELSARLTLEAAGARRVVPGGARIEGFDRIEELLSPGSRVRALLMWARVMDASLAGEPAADMAELALVDGIVRREEGSTSQPFVVLVNTLIYSDRFERAGHEIESALAAARREGSVAGFATMVGCRAALHRRLGRLVYAEADARAALDAAKAGGPQILETMYLAELLEAAIEQGAVAEAETELERRGGAGELPFQHLGTAMLLCARGRLRASTGDTGRALADLDACGAILASLGVLNPAMVPWRSYAAMARLATGDRDGARALADQELALAHRCGVATAISRSLRTRGLVEEGGEGTQLLQDALVALDDLPATMERAHALVDLGAALRRSGQRSAAAGPLHEGHELAESFGARPLAERAGVELEAAGARPRKPVRTGLEALTASERRIVDLAAGGQSNAEIAQALFVTLRTVETHLTNAYRKLGISGRRELAKALEGAAGE